MTETPNKHTRETVLKASELLGIDEATIAMALDPDLFSQAVRTAGKADTVRKILWLAPDEACRLAATAKLEDLLRPWIEAAETLDTLHKVASEVPAGIEWEMFAKERSFVSDPEDAINLCECFSPGSWQRASALALVADFAGKALSAGDYDAIHEMHEEIRTRLPEECGLTGQLGEGLEQIQLRDLARVTSQEEAFALLDRPIPRDRPGIARLTIETAIRLAEDVGALAAIMEHDATRHHQDLNRKALLKVLDLVEG